jgi:hypothetical protein
VRAVHVPCTARIDKSRSDLPLSQGFGFRPPLAILEQFLELESRLNNEGALGYQIASHLACRFIDAFMTSSILYYLYVIILLMAQA